MTRPPPTSSPEQQTLEWHAAQQTFANSLLSVAEEDVTALVSAIGALSTDDSYDALRERFGVRRTDARFWQPSCRAHAAFRKLEPIESGLFDYNRLDGR